MKKRNWICAVSAIGLGAAAPPPAQPPVVAEADSPFVAAATAFSLCLKHVVQMGMTTKMDPAIFKEGFAKSCKAEEARFRTEGVKEAMRQGRTQAEAVREIDGNIANGRRIFAGNQESYVRTGRVPR
ncbi:MAG TPA: hypothetical protein VE053_12490 [Allosphingosinicella sp.]|nr:hypothetical protein [Allosphingosinicella sp.]